MPGSTGVRRRRWRVADRRRHPDGAQLGSPILNRVGAHTGGRRLTRKCSGSHRRHPAAQRRHVAFAVRMHAAREKDHIAARRRIDPQRCAGEAGVTERSDRKQLAAIRRELRVDVPAESAHARHARRRRRRRHLRDGRRRQHCGGAEPPAVQQHAREARQIARRAEEPRVSGHAAHAPRRRIVHDAAQRRRVGRVARPRAPSSRTARSARCAARFDAGGLNPVSIMPSGSKISRCDVLIERHAAHARDDVAEQEEVDVAVDESLARRRGRHFVARQLDRRVVALPRIAEIDVGPQARDVRQQMADGDGPLAVALEPGDEASRPDRSAGSGPARPAASPRSWSRRPWSAMRDRRSCRASSARRRRDRALAVGLLEEDLVARGRRARRRPGGAGRDRLLDQSIDAGETIGVFNRARPLGVRGAPWKARPRTDRGERC